MTGRKPGSGDTSGARDELLARSEAGEHLGMTREGIRHLERNGVLHPECGEDGVWRFRRRELDAVRAKRGPSRQRLTKKERDEREARERAEQAEAERAEQAERRQREQEEADDAESSARMKARTAEFCAKVDADIAQRKAKKEAYAELEERTFDDWEAKKVLGLGGCFRTEIEGFVEDGLLTPIRCHDPVFCARDTLQWDFCYCREIRYDKAEVIKLKRMRAEAEKAILPHVSPTEDTLADIIALRDLLVSMAKLVKK
jgi:hypothetical protein